MGSLLIHFSVMESGVLLAIYTVMKMTFLAFLLMLQSEAMSIYVAWTQSKDEFSSFTDLNKLNLQSYV